MLHIRNLGYPEVYADSGRITLQRKKSLALLAYLSDTRRRVDREELRELFWSDSDRSRGLGALRTVLADISSQIDQNVLVRSGDTLFLDTERCTCDSQEFLRGIDKDRDPGTLLHLENLWRGGYLKSFSLEGAPRFNEWLFLQEQHFQRLYADLLKTLYYGFAGQGLVADAILYARKALGLDEFDEEAHRALIAALFLSGKREEAMSRHESFRFLLKEELGYPPEKETEDIHTAICAGNAEEILGYFRSRSRDFLMRTPRLAVRAFSVSPELKRKIPDGFALFAGALTDRLSDFSGLDVLARPVPAPETEKKVEPRRLSALLKAEYILEGTLEQQGNGVSITANLFNLYRDERIGRFSRNLRFSREVLVASGYSAAAGFAETLGLTLRPDLSGRASDRNPEEVSPLNVWKLRIRRLLGDLVPEKTRQIHVLLDKALEAYPEDSETWSLKAQTYIYQSSMALFGRDPFPLYEKAEEALSRALALEPENPTALWLRGLILMEKDRNWAEAEKYLFRSHERNPHNPSLLATLSEALSRQGRFREALTMADRACDLDPLYYWGYAARYWAAVGLKNYRLAARILEQQIAMLFDFPLLNEFSRGFIRMLLEKYQAAVDIIEPVAEDIRKADMKALLGMLAYAYTRVGREREARALISDLLENAASLIGYYMPLSAAYASLGDEETALDLLEQALTAGEPNLFLLIATPFYKPLEGYPRFADLIRRANLVQS